MTVRVLGSLSAGLLAALAVGCGGQSGLLDGTEAAGLKDNLELVRRAVDARDCAAAGARLRQLRSEVGNLPGRVDRELRVRLREEIVDKLAPAVQEECAPSQTQTQETPAPTGPTGPTTSVPAPEPTPEPKPQTTETTPAPTPTQTTETTPPVDPLDPNRPAPQPTPEAPTPDPGGFGASDGL